MPKIAFDYGSGYIDWSDVNQMECDSNQNTCNQQSALCSMVSGILKLLENRKIDKIAIVAIDKTNGEVITGYHDCTFADKAVMAPIFKPMQYTEVYWLMQINRTRGRGYR